jgi:hypothetical protein
MKARLGMSLVPHPLLLSLGDNIMLPKVPYLAEKDVVGHANGRHFSQETLANWVSLSWKDLGIKFPLVHSLEKG